MKNLLYSVILILLTSLSACQRSSYSHTMQQAESVMNTRPDSALYLLQSMADSLTMLPEEAQMYYHLLTIQAKDKQYITHTSDSLINRIVSFYEDYGDKERLMMAYFYQGSTYRDMNDAPRALKAFQQAMDLNVPNYDLQAKAYNQMGTLFMYQGLYDEVIRVNRKAIELYLLQGKKNKISYAQRDIARMYNVKNMPDSALRYYKEACHMALEDNDSVRYYGILGELGGYFYRIGRMEEARKTLLVVNQKSTSQNKAHIYINLGNIYEEIQQWDSAYYYYEKAMKTGDLYQLCNTFYNLSWLESHKGNHSQAMAYMKRHITLKDSLGRIKDTETVAKINALYNYQHTADENANLKLNMEKAKNRNLLLFFTFALGILLTINYFKKKQREALRIQRVLSQIEKDKYNNSLAIIKENELKISQLNEKAKACNHLEKELDLIQKEMLKLRNKEIAEANNHSDMRINTFMQSSLYELLQEASYGKVSIKDEDWVRIQSMLDYVYPHFRDRLHNLYPQLSEMEEHICILIKLSIPPTGIARIVNRTGPAITNARIRLHKKIHKTEGSSEKFDEFIKKL
ncbi:MAG: sel1 repeat family protein [Bacteroidaceae bacterium]|nr:sel1 repeat family protein [Bacteroidaceae bacterium]